jgi:hypothetical protein
MISFYADRLEYILTDKFEKVDGDRENFTIREFEKIRIYDAHRRIRVSV